jgi:ABC-type transport system involved in multi-copper enzyme maturation permease subunit
MKLLSIFDFGWGGLFILSALLMGGATAFFLYAKKISKSGGQTQATPGNGKGTIYDDKKTPITKIWAFKFAAALFVAWVVIMISIAISYAKPKEHTVTPLEDGRQAAEEQIKK